MKKLIHLILLMTLTISCLSSCRVSPEDYPKISDVEQLSPYFHYVQIDNRMYVDVEKSYCFSRKYRMTRKYLGSVGQEKRLPLNVCNKIVGYNQGTYVDVFNFQEAVRVLIDLNLQE
jgi:hypothetical protein